LDAGGEKDRNWDRIKVYVAADSFLADAADDLTARDKASSAWLHASPIPSLGLRANDSC